MIEPSSDQAAFQERMVALTRAFGWHRPETTPCGKSVPIAEAHALLELGKRPSMTQQDLARSLNLCKSTVSRLASNLEGRGWIRRRPNPRDGRALDLSLTDRGMEAAEDLAAARGAKMAEVLSNIPEAERGAVLGTLDTLIEAIRGSET